MPNFSLNTAGFQDLAADLLGDAESAPPAAAAVNTTTNLRITGEVAEDDDMEEEEPDDEDDPNYTPSQDKDAASAADDEEEGEEGTFDPQIHGLAVKTYQLMHFGGNTYGFMGSDGNTYPFTAYHAFQGCWHFQAPDGNWHQGPPCALPGPQVVGDNTMIAGGDAAAGAGPTLAEGVYGGLDAEVVGKIQAAKAELVGFAGHGDGEACISNNSIVVVRDHMCHFTDAELAVLPHGFLRGASKEYVKAGREMMIRLRYIAAAGIADLRTLITVSRILCEPEACLGTFKDSQNSTGKKCDKERKVGCVVCCYHTSQANAFAGRV